MSGPPFNQMYRMISADDHLDLQYLPADLWTARLPTSLRNRAPRVEHRDTGSVWTCEGEVWGRWAGIRRASGPKPVVNAFDRDGMDESGVGWLPWIVQELDHRFGRLWEAKDYWAERGGIDSPTTTPPPCTACSG